MLRISIKGELACFTRPEFKVERTTYDVITPSAVRGIIESIFWHPGLVWKVDRIYVACPIRYVNIRRNEVGSKASARQIHSDMQNNKKIFLDTNEKIQQRATLALRNVHYICDVHFEMTEKANSTDSAAKFQAMTKRRLEKGQNFQQPFLGCREFPAEVTLFQGEPECPEELVGQVDLGYMLYDFDYRNPLDIRPLFFRAQMKNGLIDLTKAEVRG
ncbi:type I-C CRISPR-associated protein Cas5c [Enterococcus nangangensis]|uniref:type I-C CRISPR-associated protein Cas5c n=1 Tax=Enterococcus nangangensis TaxID=2559926 RepID=UPI0010F7E2DF|nr:type I-C CRISPR-associated protein Cas5c [Enterococcus nangangensis]